MSGKKSNIRMIQKIIDRTPTWLFLIVAMLVMVFCTLMTMSEMGWLPFDMPNWSDLLNMSDSSAPYEPAVQLSGEQTACVHFIDVGQGDSILIQTREQAVLIDAGERDQGPAVCDYLKAAGVQKLDLVIATHPHSDHIGGLADVLAQFSAEEILMPALPDDMVPTTSVFLRLLDAVETQNIPVTAAKPGLSYDLGSGVVLTVLAPVQDYKDLNNYSVVCRLDSGETSFLFTGDAEKAAEADLIAAGGDLRADVLKAGHHGSSTSSSDAFLNAVSPKIVAISCGQNNDYGHPHKEVLASLSQRGIAVYRTDLQGAVTLTTDGTDITVQTGKEAAQ
ncbi:MAG: ComEC/Rec2 family competence protein [Oscillospiraceae bacterium]|nr:ComEC/Rec2 family competence protein [Oscillospiraceae bacterium]